MLTGEIVERNNTNSLLLGQFLLVKIFCTTFGKLLFPPKLHEMTNTKNIIKAVNL